MRIEIATSNQSNPIAALKELATALRGSQGDGAFPDFVAIHGRHDLMTKVFQQAAVKEFGNVKLHAASSSAGVISHRSSTEGGLATCGAIAFFDPDGDFGTGASELGEDPMAAAQKATIAALEDAGRPGEAPQFIYLSVAPGSEEKVLAGIQSVVGLGTTIMGGSAADDDTSGLWSQFSRRSFFSNGVVISALFLTSPPLFGYQNGFRPVGYSGVVTEAKGRRLISINDECASLVYARWTGQTIPSLGSERPMRQTISQGSLFPLGRVTSHLHSVPFHVLLLPTHIHPEGGIELFAEIKPGETLHMMSTSPDSIIERVGSVGRMMRGSAQEPKASLAIFCAGIRMALGPRVNELTEALSTALEGGPFLGIFTYGEQVTFAEGKAQHGNLTISCAVFS